MTLMCEFCGKSYPKRRHLRLHIARQHCDKSEWNNTCDICNKTFADQEILERHRKTHFVRIACPHDDCDIKFTSTSAMHKHRRTFHLEGVPEKAKKEYACSECDVSFSKRHLLTQHMYEHTGVLPFNCSKCDKAFSTLSHRNRHEKVHEGYNCTQCSETFETWSKLRTHISSSHRPVFKCSNCGKEFTMACRLKEHSKIHQKERTVYKCKDCERTFVKKSNLNSHIKSFHLKEKLFKCEFEGCDKAFAYKHSLKKHSKVHEPGYVTPVRKPTFGRKKISLISRITGINPYQKVEVAAKA